MENKTCIFCFLYLYKQYNLYYHYFKNKIGVIMSFKKKLYFFLLATQVSLSAISMEIEESKLDLQGGGHTTRVKLPSSYLDKGDNNSYVPQWKKNDCELIMLTIDKDNPTYGLYANIFKNKHYVSPNPNYFKNFFKSNDDKVMALSKIEFCFDREIMKYKNELDELDENFVKNQNLKIKDKKEIIQSIENEILRLKKFLINQELPNDTRNRCEGEILRNEFIIKNSHTEIEELKVNGPQKKLEKKEYLEKKIIRLTELKKILSDPESPQYSVVPKKNHLKVTINFPGFTYNHTRGAYYNDFYDQGHNEKVIVIDKFLKRDNIKTDFMHFNLKGNILKEIENEGLICTDSAHPCNVLGIIASIAPGVKIIPRIHSEYEQANEGVVWSILQNDYGAKVVNISADLGSAKLMKKLCLNHIVVMASPNATEGKGYDAWVKDALEEDENVRNHLLIAINVMPDGVTLSPITSIPDENVLSQNATVAAPGTWLKTTFPAHTAMPDNFSELYAYASNDSKPTHGWFGEVSGTSFATPVITGLVVRLLANFPNLSLEQVVKIVKDSCLKTGDFQNKAYFGNGRIDVAAAYKLAAETAKPGEELELSAKVGDGA
jgi:hypothetical protein